jgi:hypothetical protein
MALGISVDRLEQPQVLGSASEFGNVAGYAVRLQGFCKHRAAAVHGIAQEIEPIVEKLGSRLSFTLRGMRLRDIAGHGVVSGPALQRRMIRG